MKKGTGVDIVLVVSLLLLALVLGFWIGLDLESHYTYRLFKTRMEAKDVDKMDKDGWEFQQRVSIGKQHYLIFRKEE